MSEPTVEVVVAAGNVLGESPVLHRESLFWVDIVEKQIHQYRFGDGRYTRWLLPEMVGFIVFKGDQLIAGMQSGLYSVELRNDSTSVLNAIYGLNPADKNIRFNDGTIDEDGNIWCCTMDMNNTEDIGNYYRFDSSFNAEIVDKGYIVANGPALSIDRIYTVETVGGVSLQRGVYVAEIKDGLMGEKRLFISWENYDTYPDGVQTDNNGNLWVGEFGGNKLRAFTPNGQLFCEIELPAWNITKVVMNDEQDCLYVTTGLMAANEEIILEYPLTGSVLKITGFRSVMSKTD